MISTKLVNKLINQAKEKKPSIGIVHWIDGERADIRVPGSSTVYQNCVVEGDASYIERGSSVVLAWYHNRPTVISPSSQEWVTSGDLEAALAALDLDNKASGIEWNILLFRYGGLFANYPADAGGLQAALGAGGTDAIVMLPECTIGGDFIIPPGINLIGMGTNSIINGSVTCKGVGMMNFAVERSSYSNDTEEAVLLENYAELEIRDCKFTICQSSIGDAYAINAKGTRPVRIFNSYIEAIHDYGGAAYGIYMQGDDVFMYGGYLGGTTAPYLGV